MGFGCDRQPDGKCGSATFPAGDLNSPVVALDDLVGKIKSKAGAALALRAIARAKKFAPDFRLDAWSGIHNSKDDVGVVGTAFDMQLSSTISRQVPHRFRRILDEIDEDNFQLFGPSGDRRQIS